MQKPTCLLVAAAFLAACGPTDNIGRSHPPRRDGSALDFSVPGPSDDAAPITDPNDLASSLYDPGMGDGGQCTPPQMATPCLGALPINAGCAAKEDCGPSGHGNGLDDDCNGAVDDACPCTPGDVKPCFMGPPGKHNVGACTDGTQTCGGVGEFIHWGPCMGSIGPIGPFRASDYYELRCRDLSELPWALKGPRLPKKLPIW